MILEFSGQNKFLSNFFAASFVWDGYHWPTAEHAYQAAKSFDPEIRQRFALIESAAVAKRAGRLVELRHDWEQVKIGIMEQIVRAKFDQNPELKQKLIDTGTTRLEEGNWWRDRFWGVCPAGSGDGRNELGKILMRVRTEYSVLEF